MVLTIKNSVLIYHIIYNLYAYKYIRNLKNVIVIMVLLETIGLIVGLVIVCIGLMLVLISYIYIYNVINLLHYYNLSTFINDNMISYEFYIYY